jgi:hypothetical protein
MRASRQRVSARPSYVQLAAGAAFVAAAQGTAEERSRQTCRNEQVNNDKVLQQYRTAVQHTLYSSTRAGFGSASILVTFSAAPYSCGTDTVQAPCSTCWRDASMPPAASREQSVCAGMPWWGNSVSQAGYIQPPIG